MWREPLPASPLTYEDDPTARRLAGLYALADPKIAVAFLVPLLAGAAISHREGGSIGFVLLAMTVLSLLCVEVGRKAVHELYDFRSRADVGIRPDERTPFPHGKRVLVEGLLTEGEVIADAFMAFAAALVFGAFVALTVDPRLLLLGAAAAAVSFFSSAPPIRLSSRGLGEIAAFATYGPGIVLGAELLFARRITPTAVWASLSLGALIATVLLVDELPGERADREAGKRTWVVRLGGQRAARAAVALFFLAFALPVVAVVSGQTPRLLGLLVGLPAAAIAVRELLKPSGGGIGARTHAAALAAYGLAGFGIVVAMVV